MRKQITEGINQFILDDGINEDTLQEITEYIEENIPDSSGEVSFSLDTDSIICYINGNQSEVNIDNGYTGDDKYYFIAKNIANIIYNEYLGDGEYEGEEEIDGDFEDDEVEFILEEQKAQKNKH